MAVEVTLAQLKERGAKRQFDRVDLDPSTSIRLVEWLSWEAQIWTEYRMWRLKSGEVYKEGKDENGKDQFFALDSSQRMGAFLIGLSAYGPDSKPMFFNPDEVPTKREMRIQFFLQIADQVSQILREEDLDKAALKIAQMNHIDIQVKSEDEDESKNSSTTQLNSSGTT